ncbi:TPA: hypothetical protein PBB95_002601 [Staphylococcus aureus]|uniref:Uncharacterized protein n=1 Tax=Staphylococcus aureus TaxID=1280 RepID=A0A6F8P1B0_STAAU|nr:MULTISPECIES: hypothetical protein [Staphylococcus]EGQ3259954.1 hypothetical protein [Staphylococcus pseudintermedius]EGQ3289160.1 hypothetical protein [Staphylococcus pseudintermedius]EGQ4258605.1 hypothetical protein [Staphylococcus pseudintermedius]EJD5651474.1 hypothetical protein [Staphylococcus pseudintermedius]EJH4613535.1 hypothetical protein [Staphylococcus pseudintermedius]
MTKNLNKDIDGKAPTQRVAENDPKEVKKKSTQRPADLKRKTIKIGLEQYNKIDDERYKRREHQIYVLNEAIDFWDKYKKYANNIDEIIKFYEENKNK